jgi:hypothetical protein
MPNTRYSEQIVISTNQDTKPQTLKEAFHSLIGKTPQTPETHYCDKCNHQISVDDKFCTKCGAQNACYQNKYAVTMADDPAPQTIKGLIHDFIDKDDPDKIDERIYARDLVNRDADLQENKIAEKKLTKTDRKIIVFPIICVFISLVACMSPNVFSTVLSICLSVFALSNVIIRIKKERSRKIITALVIVSVALTLGIASTIFIFL